MKKQAELFVYGADVLCPSCVNLPSSKETYEWLEAALKRKYPDQPFSITYIDIHQPPENDPKTGNHRKNPERRIFLSACHGR